MKIRLLFIAFLLCFELSGYAQEEFSAGMFADRYQDEWRRVYDPGQSYQISIGIVAHEKKGGFAFSGNLGYGRYLPKADTFYSVVKDDVLGYNSYSDYRVYQFTLALRYDYLPWKHLELYFGLEFGYHVTRYYYATFDGSVTESDRAVDLRNVFIPFGGVGIPMGRFCLFVQTQYNISDDKSYHYNRSKKDRTNFIWSNGVGLRYRLK